MSTNMYIYPKYLEKASKSSWVVKFLRFIGVIQVVGCIALGVFLGGPYITGMLSMARIMDTDAASMAGPLLGLAAGIIVGLFSSLSTWALAQVVDDLHALRIQTGAYVAFETDHPKFGE